MYKRNTKSQDIIPKARNTPRREESVRNKRREARGQRTISTPCAFSHLRKHHTVARTHLQPRFLKHPVQQNTPPTKLRPEDQNSQSKIAKARPEHSFHSSCSISRATFPTPNSQIFLPATLASSILFT